MLAQMQTWQLCAAGAMGLIGILALVIHKKHQQQKSRDSYLFSQVQLFTHNLRMAVGDDQNLVISTRSIVGLQDAINYYSLSALAKAIGNVLSFIDINHPENVDDLLNDIAKSIGCSDQIESFLHESDCYFPSAQGVALRSKVVNIRAGIHE